MTAKNLVVLVCCAAPLIAQPLTERERALLDRIEQLERRMAALEGKSAAPAAVAASSAPASGAPAATAAQAAATAVPAADQKNPVLGLGSGSTVNLYLDGYYGWNFNRPFNRANPLRANDTLANNFTLNQAALILERAPDVANGRRYGARVDLMFGQNTETLQGSPANEPRPNVYRHIFQAYGTYVFPVGSGLTVDFGKFYSSLGMENNYAYDEINYSRSFYFNYLPFYHMGFRSTYNVNDKLTVQHWLVNGANQTEDFNGFKSNAFLFTIKPTKTVTWNVNYYFGKEALTGEAQTHVFDTYASWSATDKLTLAAEVDRVAGGASHVTGGIGYAQYRFSPKWALGGRFEYLRDRGGLFSGVTQDLKEHTLTATYQPMEGVQFRAEYRRDYSDHAYFPTARPEFLKKEQNTGTLGLIWWFGGKRDSW